MPVTLITLFCTLLRHVLLGLIRQWSMRSLCSPSGLWMLAMRHDLQAELYLSYLFYFIVFLFLLIIFLFVCIYLIPITLLLLHLNFPNGINTSLFYLIL